jgi:hypothetical protein
MKIGVFMVRITKLVFDLVPQSNEGENFIAPYTYIFRGVFFDWLSAVNPELAARLHEKQPKGNPLYYAKYFIQQDTLFLDSTGMNTRDYNNIQPANRDNHNQSTNRDNYADQQESYNRRRQRASGLRFTVLLFEESLTKATLDHILNTSSQTVQFGPQQAIITKIAVESINTEEFVKNTRPLHSVSLRFFTPTYFSAMGRNYEMRFPLPTYVFGNLQRFWNALHQEKQPDLLIRKDFYSWVYKSVFAASFQLETKAWESGKDKKMVGVTGWASYVSQDKEEYFSRCWDTLIKFGQIVGAGNERTVNFGRFKVDKIQYDSEQMKDLKTVPLPPELDDSIPMGLD